jgi:hypothetical protein
VGDPNSRRERAQLAETRHIRSYPELHMRSYADSSLLVRSSWHFHTHTASYFVRKARGGRHSLGRRLLLSPGSVATRPTYWSGSAQQLGPGCGASVASASGSPHMNTSSSKSACIEAAPTRRRGAPPNGDHDSHAGDLWVRRRCK